MQMAWMVFPRPMSSASSRRPLCAIAKLKWTRSAHTTAPPRAAVKLPLHITGSHTAAWGGRPVHERPLPQEGRQGPNREQGGNSLEKTTNRHHVLCLLTQSCPTFRNPMDCSLPGSSVHGDSPGKNTGVGCHALLQGIFPIQGVNSGLPHCRQILYHLSHKKSP